LTKEIFWLPRVRLVAWCSIKGNENLVNRDGHTQTKEGRQVNQT